MCLRHHCNGQIVGDGSIAHRCHGSDANISSSYAWGAKRSGRLQELCERKRTQFTTTIGLC